MSRVRALLGWRDWTPGIDNGERTLGAVLGTLPGAAAHDIPLAVRILENPASLVAFPGAVTLARHDVVHVLVGRGLRPADEAFVIGFTMGNDPKSFRFGRRVAGWKKNLFLTLASWTYPRVFRWTPTQENVFRKGFWEGRKAYARSVHEQRAGFAHAFGQSLTHSPIETMMDRPIAELRRGFGISLERLRTVFRLEQLETPSREARRLDICADTDIEDIAPPEGGRPSDWKRG